MVLKGLVIDKLFSLQASLQKINVRGHTNRDNFYRGMRFNLFTCLDTSVLSTPSDASLHSIGNSLQEEDLTTAVENLGHFTKRILGGLGGGRVKSHRRKKKTKFVQRRQDSSITGGNVVIGARDLGSRIDTTLNHIRAIIPEAIESVEKDIAISNRDKVILALANFLGSRSIFICLFKKKSRETAL